MIYKTIVCCQTAAVGVFVSTIRLVTNVYIERRVGEMCGEAIFQRAIIRGN